MRYFDMFAGVGGFSLGIERAYEEKNRRMAREGGQDVRMERPRPEEGDMLGDSDVLHERDSGCPDTKKPSCIGLSEIDKYASAVLKYRFPNTTNYGDCSKINWSEVPDFDLLTGGVPCQSWSIAGKRGGFDDLRGTMWWEFTRALREKQPKWFIAENVKGLLSHDKGKSFEKICEELCDCGYAIDFELLNAKNFGVPQNRERVFIIGKRLDTCQENEVI